MKIAIVGPSPIPFTMGGVEYFLSGLAEGIRDNTDNIVELIKVPTLENDFWSLLDSYKMFYELDLTHFDLVISTKYPAWMVQHNNQICYMQHCLRGLYDTYHFTQLPTETDRDCEEVNIILDYIRSNNTDIKKLFSLLDGLKQEKYKVDKKYFSFPGPFIREIIHYLDQTALNNVKSFYSISQTVKDRKEYFPKNANVEVLHHPTHRPKIESTSYEHIFLMSRLDGPKRFDLLINAMKYVKSDIKLYIAGTGPSEKMLKELAKDDDRIEFLGFISDEDAEKYYANSKFVPYFPYDEDFGLITIEAMKSNKIVLTTTDSGGPTEFVVEGETGFICKPNPKSIGESINKICNLTDSQLEKMGEKAYNKVKDITWESVVSSLNKDLTMSKTISVDDKEKENILLISSYEIFPPRHGGQERIYHLYKNVLDKYNVTVLALTRDMSGTTMLEKNYVEHKVKYSNEFIDVDNQMSSKLGVSVTDIMLIDNYKLNREFVEKFKELSLEANKIVFEHPYLVNAIDEIDTTNKEVYYDSHNNEYLLKKSMLNLSAKHKDILDSLFNVEQRAIKESKLVYACSESDIESYKQIYDTNGKEFVFIPNGVDIDNYTYFSVNEKIKLKEQTGLLGEKIVIFIGSWHKPNLDASEEIFKIAKKTPNVKYLIIGNQCGYFANKKLPENVFLMGMVSDEEKMKLFRIADIALNPMLTGSGTNLKMFAYMASGIPILTTEVGARGIDENYVMVSEIENFAEVIEKFNPILDSEKMTKDAYRYTDEKFSWKTIAKQVTSVFEN